MSKRKAEIECPAWLEGLAKSEWDRLIREGVVVPTAENVTLITGYCQSYARWRGAEEVLNAEGTEIVVRDDKGTVKAVIPSPQIGISTKYYDRMLKTALQLGLNTDRPGVSKFTKAPKRTESAPSSFFGTIPSLN